MGLSRQEVNLRRLLTKCEFLLKSNQKDDQRFPKYIASLEEMLDEVKTLSSPNEYIPDYSKRIWNLKFQLGMLVDEELAAGDGMKMTAREELLDIRKRNVKQNDGVGDLDQLLEHHQNVQEKIAEEMLSFTKSLKEQSALANKIIKNDTEVVHRSTHLTDQNFSKLKGESEKLTEHSKKAWKCWMWIIILIVLVIFINMVLFMKVMKKK